MAKKRQQLSSLGNTPDSVEKSLIGFAMELAAKQLMEGTASSQVITHFLKLGSSVNRDERELAGYQKDLMKAKTEAIKDQKTSKELYANAIKAMRVYQGGHVDDPEIL